MGTKIVRIDISAEDLARIRAKFVPVFNEAQRDGFTIEEVYFAALYLMGGVARQAGIVVDFDQSVREAMPVMVDGYDTTDANLRELEAKEQAKGSEPERVH